MLEDKNPIYTRDEAARIVALFEDLLIKNEISVPSPEDYERDPEDDLGLYGSTYYDLLDEVEDILREIILKRGPKGPKNDFTWVVFGKFSGETAKKHD